MPNNTSQQLLDNFVVQLRAVISSFSKDINKMNALNAAWTANISAIVGTPSGALVSDSTNLAGAAQLTDTQVQQLVTDIQAVLAAYDTAGAQQLYALVCGPMNTI